MSSKTCRVSSTLRQKKSSQSRVFFKLKGCGIKANIAPIVGGVDSVPNSWPWAAAIFQRSTRDPTKRSFICGGSIIDQQYILSAAHCVVRYEGKMKAEDFFVKVGGHDVRTSGTFHDVAAVYAHENYRSWRRYNDISLFKLADKLDFSDPKVRPVCLPTADMANLNMTGQKTAVIGWGTTSFMGPIANNLREADIEVIDNQVCDQSYKSVEGNLIAYPQGITDNFICAGKMEGGTDSCQGDSGGPLLWQQGNRWYQLGIVSFGYRCAERGYPGVYTRTSSFLKWIGSHTGDKKKKHRVRQG